MQVKIENQKLDWNVTAKVRVRYLHRVVVVHYVVDPYKIHLAKYIF